MQIDDSLAQIDENDLEHKVIHLLNRTRDVLFATTIAFFGLPFAGISYLINETYYKQKRIIDNSLYNRQVIGLNGVPIYILKITTLRKDSGNSLFAGDQREKDATLLGRILRKTKIDEYFQFINMLSGQLSSVGNRPPGLDEYNGYEKDWESNEFKKIFSVPPGATGPAQLWIYLQEHPELDSNQSRHIQLKKNYALRKINNPWGTYIFYDNLYLMLTPLTILYRTFFGRQMYKKESIFYKGRVAIEKALTL